MKNLQEMVIKNHELGVLNYGLLYFFNNFAFEDFNHFKSEINQNLTFPTIVKLLGFNQYCYIYKGFLEEMNKLYENNTCYDVVGTKINKERLNELFCKYLEGFNYGYNNFLSNVSENQNFNDNLEEKFNLIFKRVLRPDLQKRGRFKFDLIFKENSNELLDAVNKAKSANDFNPPNFEIDKVIFDVSKFYECGLGGGEYFKAWEIIFENQNKFVALFNEVGINLESLNFNNFDDETIDGLPQDSNIEADLELNQNHPYYHSNFNLSAFRLFLYLLDNYDNVHKNKYSNIFYLIVRLQTKVDFS